MEKLLFNDQASRSKSLQSQIDIIRLLAIHGNASISDLTKETGLSVPTVSKFIAELIDQGYLIDYGKQETTGGRKPNIYGLNPASGYFVGVDLRRYSLSVGIIDFYGEMVFKQLDVPYEMKNTPEALDSLCDTTLAVIAESGISLDNIVAYSFNLSGRVDRHRGYSYNSFFCEEKPLTLVLEERLKSKVFIDNDSRAMCYGEYMKGLVDHQKDVLFINISWGLGMGMVLDGKLYYGASGYSGELGHFPLFNNEIFCHCGKKGCLETEASGLAMHRLLLEKHRAGARSVLSPMIDADVRIRTEDMVRAILQEDMLMIEIVEEIGSNLGKGIAGLINLFNPELVIIGGVVAEAGDYLLLPVKSSVKKYSLNLVNKDTEIVCSTLGDLSGIYGACFIARNQVLGLL